MDAKLALERRKGEERADEHEVVRLHDGGSRYGERPGNGLTVVPQGLFKSQGRLNSLSGIGGVVLRKGHLAWGSGTSLLMETVEGL